MPIGEGRDGDVDLGPALHADGVREARDGELRIRRTLGLYSVDELDELRRALQVPEERLVLRRACRRIASQREEARDAGIQEFPDERVRARVRAPDARQVRERR